MLFFFSFGRARARGVCVVFQVFGGGGEDISDGEDFRNEQESCLSM